jgi:hypothetical protein
MFQDKKIDDELNLKFRELFCLGKKTTTILKNKEVQK